MELNRRNFVRGAAAMGAGGRHGCRRRGLGRCGACRCRRRGLGRRVRRRGPGPGWRRRQRLAVAAYEEGAKVLVCEKAPEGQEPCMRQGQWPVRHGNRRRPGPLHLPLPAHGQVHQLGRRGPDGRSRGSRRRRTSKWMARPDGRPHPDIVCPTAVPESGGPHGRLLDSYPTTPGAWAARATSTAGTSSPRIPESVHCKCLTATGARFDAGYYDLSHGCRERPR